MRNARDIIEEVINENTSLSAEYYPLLPELKSRYKFLLITGRLLGSGTHYILSYEKVSFAGGDYSYVTIVDKGKGSGFIVYVTLDGKRSRRREFSSLDSSMYAYIDSLKSML